MLTRELAIATFENGQLVPDRLTRKNHTAYVGYAEAMLEIYRGGVGHTRRSLHSAVQHVFKEQIDCPGRRIQAFCKLLDDASEFSKGDRRKIVQLRQSVFRDAAKQHPLVVQRDALFESQESEVKRRIAEKHGMDWPQLHDKLFSDLMEYHELKSFKGYEDARALLSRYNVAQTQVVLFDAERMTVTATGDFKQILRYAKLARLMHRISKRPDHYRFEFDGPASVLQSTHRYGIAMARFLPGLLSCRGWSMVATLRATPFRPPIKFRLDDACQLSSGVISANEFDSSVEESFSKEWGDQPRNDWRLERETEILHRGQTAFFPDFVFIHQNGTRALLEIVGFWTPEYLSYKAKVLEQFSDQPVLLAIAKPLKGKFSVPIEHPAIYFKDTIKVESVLEMLESFRSSGRSSHRGVSSHKSLEQGPDAT